MTEEVTLAQLAAEMAQLRQQMETLSQRLDMIYGAVTRLADQSSPAKATSQATSAGPKSNPAMSPAAMMNPDSMLDTLRQNAVNLGLDVSEETVERLKSQTSTEPATDEQSAPSD